MRKLDNGVLLYRWEIFYFLSSRKIELEFLEVWMWDRYFVDIKIKVWER